MQLGILQTIESEKLKSKIESGEVLDVGVSVQSLIEDIEFNLFATKYDAATTLQALHKTLLEVSGKIVVKKKDGAQ